MEYKHSLLTADGHIIPFGVYARKRGRDGITLGVLTHLTQYGMHGRYLFIDYR